MVILFFLSSGLFLGWSLGANDSANIFGTAVGSKMVKFKYAAIVASIFVVLGATYAGSGASRTLGELGSINAIAGAFVVSLAAALSVFWMTRIKLPVSTSQAIVGAIVGWNFFSHSLTNYNSLAKIILTWFFSPVIAAVCSILIYFIGIKIMKRVRIHLIMSDHLIRLGLIIVGAFGAYSLGANNIANVMGVFVPVTPFKPISFLGLYLSGAQQLFFIGGIAIAVGIISYSRHVMETVGNELFPMKPVVALIAVLSMSIVMFLFSSVKLESILLANGLPAIPLVPVSSSQAIIGAIVGIGIFHGGRGLNVKILTSIAAGWVVTPLIAGLLCFTSLFFIQNVFNQKVYQPVSYKITGEVLEYLSKLNVNTAPIEKLKHVEFKNAKELQHALEKIQFSSKYISSIKIIEISKIENIIIDVKKLNKKDKKWFTKKQLDYLQLINKSKFKYFWQFKNKLILHKSFSYKKSIKINKSFNVKLTQKIHFLRRMFKN